VPLTQLAFVSGSGPSSQTYIYIYLYIYGIDLCVRVRFVFAVRGYDFVHVLLGFFGKSFNCQVAKANRPAIGIFPQFICLLRTTHHIWGRIIYCPANLFGVQGRGVKMTKLVKLSGSVRTTTRSPTADKSAHN